ATGAAASRSKISMKKGVGPTSKLAVAVRMLVSPGERMPLFGLSVTDGLDAPAAAVVDARATRATPAEHEAAGVDGLAAVDGQDVRPAGSVAAPAGTVPAATIARTSDRTVVMRRTAPRGRWITGLFCLLSAGAP